MISDNQLIYIHLEKIVKSRHFNKSKISCDLLSYLVEASLDGKNPKEYTIGIELFGKKYDDETKQDSNIRVYIHTVRKKLENYYANEGKKDAVIFVIEKGKYKVRFDSLKEHKRKKQASYFLPFVISSILLIFLLTVVLFSGKNRSNSWKDLPVWHQFSDNGKKTILVLGDYFVFSGVLPTGNSGIYRDFSINSEAEYQNFLEENPDLLQSLTLSNLTYLSKMAVFTQSDIQKVFAMLDADIEVRLSSDMQPDDLKAYNIIFVGNFKNMGIFENMVKEMNFSFGISNDSRQMIFSNDPCANIFESQNTSVKETDYALVINTEGFSGNRFLFFLSSQDIGNISTVNQFTSPVYLKLFFEEELKQANPEDFKALFKVEGMNKTDLSFELLKVE